MTSLKAGRGVLERGGKKKKKREPGSAPQAVESPAFSLMLGLQGRGRRSEEELLGGIVPDREGKEDVTAGGVRPEGPLGRARTGRKKRKKGKASEERCAA